MSLLQKAENQMAFGKVGIMGFAGSGKTFTSTKVAIGLHKMIGSKKPIAFLDTETGSDFVLPMFKAEGIELLVAKSKSFVDLMSFMDEAQKSCDIAIIDSITHIWNEIQQSFIDKINEERARKNWRKIYRLEFQHWNQIKPEWRKFTDKYLTCEMHVILCGRAGYEYDYQQLDGGEKKELLKTGTKMKAETEMAYEPSLLIEMDKDQINPDYDDSAKRAKKERQVINRAFVLKDRADLLDGKVFDSPTFETFKPHFDFLNIGGEHRAIDKGNSSSELFNDEGKSDFNREKHEKTKALEDIQGLMVSIWPGQSAAEKKAKGDALYETFGTRSWTAIGDKYLDELISGFNTMSMKYQNESKSTQS